MRMTLLRSGLAAALILMLVMTGGFAGAQELGVKGKLTFPTYYLVERTDEAGVRLDVLADGDTDSSGNYYIWNGAVVDGKAHGTGVLEEYLADGRPLCVVHGTYDNGRMEGTFAAEYGSLGKQLEWRVRDGRLDGTLMFTSGEYRGVLLLERGKPVHGRFESKHLIADVPCGEQGITGRGMIHWIGKIRYEGDLVYGQPEGRGRVTYEDGKYYDGGFRGGRISGHGSLFNADGSLIVSGAWENGELVSQD